MTDQSKAPTLGPPTADDNAGMLHIVNAMHSYFSIARQTEEQPAFDSLLMAAAMVFAGVLHGELMACDAIEDVDLTDEQIAHMAIRNFRSGEAAAKVRVAKMAAAMAAAEAEAARQQGHQPN